jgi:hypothetical protein
VRLELDAAINESKITQFNGRFLNAPLPATIIFVDVGLPSCLVRLYAKIKSYCYSCFDFVDPANTIDKT